jgi:hypothetical protein
VPGRSASCPSPAPRWCATYAGGTPAASRKLAGGARCSRWRARSGCARAPPRRPWLGAHHAGAGDELLDTLAERFALGHRAVISVVDPSLVVLAGGVLTAGGTRLRDLIADEVGSLALTRPRSSSPRRHREPGAGRARADRPRRHPATSSSTPSSTEPQPDQSPGENHDQTHPTPRGPTPLAEPRRARPATGGQRLHRLLRGRHQRRPRTRTSPITFWHGWSADSEVAAIQQTIDAFEKANPNIHVKASATSPTTRSTRRCAPAAPPPRRRLVVHHRQRGAVLHLGRLRRPDAVHGEVRHRPAETVPAGAAEYTQYEGNQCALPLLSDAYGLYYNKDAFAAAASPSRPRPCRSSTRTP